MATKAGHSLKSVSCNAERLVRVGYYELEKTIGKGNFAVAKLAVHRVTKSVVAIKIIDKSKIDEDHKKRIRREIEIMKMLRHPFITQLYEVMETDRMIYLVTEYASCGELFDHLVQHGRIPEHEANVKFLQIVAALSYCHRKGIVHRDLKAENLLLDKDMNIKLVDFGFSNFYTPGVMMSTCCGSPPYAAPELFVGKEYDGPRADIWCEELIRRMLQVDPDKRLSIPQILEHIWINKGTEQWVRDIIQYYESPDADRLEPVNQLVVEHMLKLPGVEREAVERSVQEQKFNNLSAIHDLFVDQLKLTSSVPSPSSSSSCVFQPSQDVVYSQHRRSSITTGVVDRSPISDSEDQSTAVPLFSSPVPPLLQDQYLEKVLEEQRLLQLQQGMPSIGGALDIPATFGNFPAGNTLSYIPHLNYSDMPSQNFVIKDQHLLKPPPVMGATGGFSRRASDGGANLQMYFQQHLAESGHSHPCSQEQVMQIGVSPAVTSHPISVQEDIHISHEIKEKRSSNETEPSSHVSSISKENTEGQHKIPAARCRRSGLPTVMSRPPVFNSELIKEIENKIEASSQFPIIHSFPTTTTSSVTTGITSGIPHASSLSVQTPHETISYCISANSYGANIVVPGIMSGIPPQNSISGRKKVASHVHSFPYTSLTCCSDINQITSLLPIIPAASKLQSMPTPGISSGIPPNQILKTCNDNVIINNNNLLPASHSSRNKRQKKTGLETVLEAQWADSTSITGNSVGRDSFRDTSPVHLSTERYSPIAVIRRASDSTISLSDINQEFQKLQRHSGNVDSVLQAELQRGHAFHWRGGSQYAVGQSHTPTQAPSSTCSSPAGMQNVGGSPCLCPLSPCPHHRMPNSPIMSPALCRSLTPSPPIPPTTPPPVQGTPLHQHPSNLEGAVWSLNQLHLQTSPGSPRSPQHHCHSPPSSLSPQSQCISPRMSPGPVLPSTALSCSRSGPSPPSPLTLDSIREEPVYTSKSPSKAWQLFNQNPQISVTDETGGQFLITSSSSSDDDSSLDIMDTSPVSPDAFPPGPLLAVRLPKVFSLDSTLPCLKNCDFDRPSIIKGTGVSVNKSSAKENNNIRTDRTLVRQDAIVTSSAGTARELYITGLEMRHTFPPNGEHGIEENVGLPHIANLQQLHKRTQMLKVELQKTGSESLLVDLPNKWAALPVHELVEMIVQTVEVRAPYLIREVVRDCCLCVRDSTGAQVELEVSEGLASYSRALKMRRVSGDELQYSQICQQLIDCMTT